jgi:ABC-2 type transport system ATP-binding protein
MPPILDIRHLHKRYGETEALRDVSFCVEPGEFFGLLGPNGAGKTTLLTILACLADPTSGEVLFAGKPLSRKDLSLRREIGIGTQDLSVYGELTARENLVFFGKLYGLHGDGLRRRVDEVLELIGLTERSNQRVSTFSGGMKRRLNLGVAIVHRPRLLLLDEPTTGVDPQSRNHIFERARELNAAGLTVVYSSHYMEEVQTLCPRVGILDHGKMIACDAQQALLRRLEGSIEIRVAGDVERVKHRVAELPGMRIASIRRDAIELACADASTAVVAVVEALRELNVALTALHMHEPNLEQVFLHLTERTLRD